MLHTWGFEHNYCKFYPKRNHSSSSSSNGLLNNRPSQPAVLWLGTQCWCNAHSAEIIRGIINLIWVSLRFDKMNNVFILPDVVDFRVMPDFPFVIHFPPLIFLMTFHDAIWDYWPDKGLVDLYFGRVEVCLWVNL